MSERAPDSSPRSERPNAYAPPRAQARRAPEKRPAPTTATRGQRIAGGVFLATAALGVLDMAIMRANLSAEHVPKNRILSVMLSLTLGVFLVSGSRKPVPWAIGICVLGVLGSIAAWLSTSPIAWVSPLVALSAQLLLLVGDAGKRRIAVAAAILSMYGLLRLAEIGESATGRNPLAPLLMRSAGTIEPEPAGVVTGVKSHYRLRAASDRWHLRTPEGTKQAGVDLDRWLIRPDLDAHLQVVDQQAPGKIYTVDSIVEGALKQASQDASEFEVLGREPLRTHPHDGRLVHTRTTISTGARVEALRGFVSVYGHSYQIVGYAPARVFPEVEGELRAMIESFELPTDEQPILPEYVEPTPVERVEGVEAKYTLSFPNGRWYLRKREVTKQLNQLADVMVDCPEKNTNVAVIIERVPGVQVDLDKFTEVVVGSTPKVDPEAKLLSREPLQTNPSGRLLHLRTRVQGEEVEKYEALFVQGELTFRVIATSHAVLMAGMRDEILTIFASFTLPAPASPPP